MPIFIVHYHEHELIRSKTIELNYRFFGLITPFIKKRISFSCGLKPLLSELMKTKINMDIILIVNFNENTNSNDVRIAKRKYELLKSEYEILSDILFHDNIGFDFGAWDKGLNFYEKDKPIDFDEKYIFMNTSLRGPIAIGWLEELERLYTKMKKVGIIGNVLNPFNTNKWLLKKAPHIQSYFFYLDFKMLEKIRNQNDGHLPGFNLKEKKLIIEKGEIKLSSIILDLGYGLLALNQPFNNKPYFKNESLFFEEGEFDFRFNDNMSGKVNMLFL